MTEREIAERAARGDTEAFGELVDRYGRDVFRLALSMTGQKGDAEDLMQDTFLAAYEGIGKFAGRSSFKTWLLGILFRQAGRKRRYLRLRRTEPLDAAAGSAARGGGGEDTARAMDIHAMLASLTPEHRDVVVLRELQGLSYKEIAETLGIAQGTVESRLFRARLHLRELLQEYGTRPAPRAPSATRPGVESNDG